MNKGLIKDIIEWDIVNWSKAIQFWEKNIDFNNKNYKCLELGGRSGGMSLWLANKGFEVICSDIENPKPNASKLHSKYNNLNITYEAVNALEIPYENEFDIIIFKSIVGGISRGGKDTRKKIAIDQMYKALKPGGKLLFSENLQASALHNYLRKRFVRWGNEWNYLKLSEVDSLFSKFEKVNYKTAGFFATFGRNEKQRNFLGKIDTLIEPIIGENYRYIVMGIAEKQGN